MYHQQQYFSIIPLAFNGDIQQKYEVSRYFLSVRGHDDDLRSAAGTMNCCLCGFRRSGDDELSF
jgi:hypothetical protein